ncbi:MAG: hypothetical protein NVV59_15950 [Chitinophagaceae bacterium]|nr:hypothetical protein [Chitinophagaceae bacterium]
MTATLKYRLIAFSLFFISYGLNAQMLDTARLNNLKPPKNRELFHDNIDKEQKGLLASDGKADQQFNVSTNEEINLLLTRVVTRRIDEFQYNIETDSLLDHRMKVNYLSGMSNLLRYVKQNWKSKTVNPLQLDDIIDAYLECMELDKKGSSIEPVIKRLPYDAGTAVMAAENFQRNSGYRAAKDQLILKYCLQKPSQTFLTLKSNPDVPFADSLIKLVAKKYPSQLYTYAQADNKLGVVIRNIKDDPFVAAVSRMSRSKSGQVYFPFLDNIVQGKITFEEIDQAERDSVQYFRLLVKTQLQYVDRMLNGDTAYAHKDLLARLEKKAKDVFVGTINALHNENANVRFRCLQNLTAEELYYAAVLSDGLIYTSSYTAGVYPLMMQKDSAAW